MKKLLVFAAFALLVFAPARAQELTYALPNTVFTVQVEVRQDYFYAGPYAAFAKKLLNIDVRDQDALTCTVTALDLIPRIEADPKALFLCEPENAQALSLSAQGLIALQEKALPDGAQWRFLPPAAADFSSNGLTGPEKTVTRITYKSVQTEEDTTVQVPVEHKVSEAKTLEDKAAEAADMILAVRKDRLNIVSGNTDASYSGEAMGAALRELDRIEQEYLTLFRGYSVSSTQTASFDIIPDARQRVHRYLAFRLTEDGPVPDGLKGVPYYLELEPENTDFPEEEEKKTKNKVSAVKYRIPVVCRVKVTRDGKRLLDTRLPVYQLGKEVNLYK